MAIDETIERLKSLSGHVRQMDFAIAVEIGYEVRDDRSSGGPPVSRWYNPEGQVIARVPFFTLKVDEAMILLNMLVKDPVCALTWNKTVWRAQLENGPIFFGPTSAIALCLAALNTIKS